MSNDSDLSEVIDDVLRTVKTSLKDNDLIEYVDQLGTRQTKEEVFSIVTKDTVEKCMQIDPERRGLIMIGALVEAKIVNYYYEIQDSLNKTLEKTKVSDKEIYASIHDMSEEEYTEASDIDDIDDKKTIH